MTRQVLKSKTFLLFERLLLLLVLPCIGIVVPLVLDFFPDADSHKKITGCFFCIVITFAVWFGCRSIFIGLRFSERLHLRYPQFLLLYFFLAFCYSFFFSWFAFRLLQDEVIFFRWNVLLLPAITAVFAAFISVVYESILLYEQINLQRLENESLRRAQAATQLNSLKTRIDPHFLFNSLNTLQNLIIEDKETANNFNKTLSELFAQVLTLSGKNMVSLHEELSFMHKYYYLVSIRFPEAIRLRVVLRDFHLQHATIPPLSLQLLFENAIKHNFFSAKEPLEITVDVSGNHVRFCNKKTKPVALMRSPKAGLKILNDQFRILFKRPIEIINDEQAFCVLLPVKTSYA